MPAKKYGAHIGAIHSWIQWNAFNGDRVTWGSDEVLNLKRALTVRDLENIAQMVADVVIDDRSLVTAEKIQAAWAAAGHPEIVLRTSGRYLVRLSAGEKQAEYLLLQHALGALMRLPAAKEEDDPHCLIYGRLDEPIGCCFWSGREDVLAEEPDATFKPVDAANCPICKKAF